MDEDLEDFTVVTGAETILPEPVYEGTNASRFAIVATLGARNASGPAVEPRHLEQFGFSSALASLVERHDPPNPEYSAAEALLANSADGWVPPEVRVRAWHGLNERAELDACLPLLAAGICSSLDRESVVAAVAFLNSSFSARFWRGSRAWLDTPWFNSIPLGGQGLWWALLSNEGAQSPTITWPGKQWANFSNAGMENAIRYGDRDNLLQTICDLALLRIDLGRRSSDPIVKQLAAASFLNRRRDPVEPTMDSARHPNPKDELTSTMVHGTWSWKGDWWYPGGLFHEFIRDKHRRRLYEGGKEFSWSGAYSKKQRTLGGERFKRWVESEGRDGRLATVFAHSYGGEIVARAVNSGAAIDEVVLLSAPIHGHHHGMLDRVRRVMDVRLKFDIVLQLAGAGQQLPAHPNVVVHIIDRPLWSHSASHHPEIWRSEGIAESVGL